ncbi:MAG: hypothetical protein HY000_37540, partial [Planctomycetes bacterium]|nr:hypothetical protein [Planctomycetota bacterium]
NEAGRSRDALQPELIARYRRDLEELADLCESRGIKLALATFASSWNPHDPSTASPARWARAAADMPWVATEPMYAAMQACREIAAQVAHERGIPLVRMEQKIPPNESNFYDTIHLSPQGAAMLAHGFFDLMEEQHLFSAEMR